MNYTKFPYSIVSKYAVRGYIGLIAVSSIYGVCRGSINWVDWRCNRAPYKIAYKDVEPIVNAIVDGGMLVGHIGLTTTGCAVVAATFPVSVPILLSTREATKLE